MMSWVLLAAMLDERDPKAFMLKIPHVETAFRDRCAGDR